MKSNTRQRLRVKHETSKPSTVHRRRIACGSLLMNLAVWVLALTVTPWVARGQVVAGYYADWTTDEYPPSAIRMENLTHILHAFAWPNADGSISYRQGFLSFVPELTQRAHASGKKVLLSLGGYTDSSDFSPMAANPAARSAFILNLTAFCLDNDYDGADFDWEYPDSEADKQNLTLLVQELRAHWNQVAPALMLTMTIDASFWWGAYYDVETLHPLLDWIGVMTYCYYGSWYSMTGHNSPLYSDPLDPMNAGSTDESIRQYFHDMRGVPWNKLVSGIPFFGAIFTGTTELYQPAGGGVQYTYTDLSTLNYTYHWDNVSQVPYLTSPDNGGVFVTLDDAASVRLKCQYAKTYGLAGVMLWEISQDLLSSGEQPLLTAVGSEMLATPPVVGPINDYAASEIRNAGTISGSLTALMFADNVYESIKEVLSQGTVKTRYSYLDHVWVVNVTGGSEVAFYVQAHHSSNRENDHFAFSYSTDAVTYTPMLTVTKTADDNTTQSFTLPSTLRGTVYIRVRDTDRTPRTKSRDTLYVDQLYIRSVL
ncbi:MAG: glycoside hydrolase family 18 protein [Lentisphaerae bacterium]|nr:glycoside hydrolase family 18 protein [Lentisphaerota bacterium]